MRAEAQWKDNTPPARGLGGARVGRERVVQRHLHLDDLPLQLQRAGRVHRDGLAVVRQGVGRPVAEDIAGEPAQRLPEHKRQTAMLDRGAHDLAWIEKEALPWLPASLERLLLRRMPCVLDYDDAVFHGYDRHRSGAVRMLLGQRIDRLMRAARVVVAGNEYLAARARSAGAQSVAVVPTVVDLAHYPEGEHRQAGGQVPRVAWIGSPSTSAYLSLVSAPLAEVAREFPFILRVIGGGNVSLPGVEVESIAWRESDESRLLRECSIGIMPLPDEPWERGKCGYKLVQYMACGLPVMASPVGANVALVDGQGVGFLAGDAGEWASGLRTLLGNAPLRRRMGARGREHVERKYSAQVQVDRIADLLSGALASLDGWTGSPWSVQARRAVSLRTASSGRHHVTPPVTRSSTSSSVTSAWFTTMVEMNALSASRVGLALNSISLLTPSVGSAWKRLSERPPGPIRTNRATRLGCSSARRIAVPPPRLLPSRCTRSMPSSSSSATTWSAAKR